jgi:hypothetical protein
VDLLDATDHESAVRSGPAEQRLVLACPGDDVGVPDELSLAAGADLDLERAGKP